MTIKRRKVSVIGAGFTGATAALMIAQKELADVVLVDIPDMEDPTKARPLICWKQVQYNDLMQILLEHRIMLIQKIPTLSSLLQELPENRE